MMWNYTLRCTAGPRLLMRVALLFDQQLLNIASFAWLLNEAGDEVRIELSVACHAPLAERLKAKLLHLHDVSEVELQACVVRAEA